MLQFARKKIGSDDKNAQPKYSFPPMVLKLVWAFVPQNVKGELWLDAYELAL